MNTVRDNNTASINYLIDRYGRRQDYLRISLTDRCNLRCTYCMPAGGVAWRPDSQLLTNDEVERVVRVMAKLGVVKIRLTGGEPTLRPGLVELVSRLRAISGIQTVALTTNGVRFSEFAQDLKAAGLSAVNISLDSLQRDNFARITSRDWFDRVWTSVESALRAGFAPLKLNMVVMPGVNDGELLDFVELTRTLPLNVRFIEYMPFKHNRWDPAGFISYDSIRRTIEQAHSLHALPETFTVNRVAEDFVIPGFRGRVSIIASMTRSFCHTCSRLRLTADGALKACLFFPAQVQLRSLLREDVTDEILGEAVRHAVLLKPSGHPDPAELEGLNDLSMIEIGG